MTIVLIILLIALISVAVYKFMLRLKNEGYVLKYRFSRTCETGMLFFGKSDSDDSAALTSAALSILNDSTCKRSKVFLEVNEKRLKHFNKSANICGYYGATRVRDLENWEPIKIK